MCVCKIGLKEMFATHCWGGKLSYCCQEGVFYSITGDSLVAIFHLLYPFSYVKEMEQQKSSVRPRYYKIDMPHKFLPERYKKMFYETVENKYHLCPQGFQNVCQYHQFRRREGKFFKVYLPSTTLQRNEMGVYVNFFAKFTL